MKKIISFLCALAMIILCSGSTSALGINPISTQADYTSSGQIVSDLLVNLSLNNPSIAAESIKNAQLGQKIFVYTLVDGQVVQSSYSYLPVLSDGKIVAIASYSEDDSAAISLTTRLVDDINEYISDVSNAIAILYDGRTAYICSPNGSTQKTGSNSISVQNDTAFSTSDMIFEEISPVMYLPEPSKDLVSMNISGYSITKNPVGLPAKNQQPNTLICWAACVASVGQQQTGKIKSAQDVATTVGKPFESGNVKDVISALSSIYRVSANATEAPPSTNAILPKLNANKPYIWGLMSGASTVGHMVAINSFTGNSTGALLGYMDPWDGTFASIRVLADRNYKFELWGQSYSVNESVVVA